MKKTGLSLATILTGAALASGNMDPVGAATVGADPNSTSYQQGAADRDVWEEWFRNLTGAEWEGANYWAGQRSLKTPVPCSAHASYGDDWLSGCTAAKRRLAVSDIKRNADPQYRDGWNKVGAAPPAEERQESDQSKGIGLAPPGRQAVGNTRPQNSDVLRPGWLGVRVQQVTPELADSVGLTDTSGAMVSEVTVGSAAERAKIRRGDIIFRVEGWAVKDVHSLSRIVSGIAAGTLVNVLLWRDGKKVNAVALLGDAPETATQARTETVFATSGGLQVTYGQKAGALICPSGDAVRLALDLMADSRQVEALTPGARRMWEAQHGKYIPFDPSDINCVIAPPGTRLYVGGLFGFLNHVTGDRSDGGHIDGYAYSWALERHGD